MESFLARPYLLQRPPAWTPTIPDFSNSTDQEPREPAWLAGTVSSSWFMKELLEQFLPKPPSRIIDIGGGTGLYSSWLASLGHIVHLVDVVPGHVEEASGDGRFTASVADARALPVSDESYDVALLLGPLYHLPKLADRLQAMREARRVVREHGMIVAAFVCRRRQCWMDS